MAKRAQVGDPAPDFELPGTDGTFRLSDHLGERVVLLFYPGDFTPVCTRQFCSYSERAEDVDGLGATLVGISSQGLDSHEQFVAKHGLNIPLLADEDCSVAKAYGVHARVVGTFSGDGRTVNARWEKSGDDGSWELDFELTYTRR